MGGNCKLDNAPGLPLYIPNRLKIRCYGCGDFRVQSQYRLAETVSRDVVDLKRHPLVIFSVVVSSCSTVLNRKHRVDKRQSEGPKKFYRRKHCSLFFAKIIQNSFQ